MFNHNFNNFQRNWFTFQHMRIPPPPLPPPYLVPPMPSKPIVPDNTEFLKYYESRLTPKQQKPKALVNISCIKEQLKDVLVLLNSLKEQENDLRQNMTSLCDEEWCDKLKRIEDCKKQLNEAMSSVNRADFGVLKKLVIKRTAKRMRLKRLKADIKVDKEQRKKDREENSRKIDEYLQRVKDEMDKSKQEEKAKAIADTVLKDVLRKKQDAKKCLVKLDALIKLRKAKMNTAKGRGENVSEHGAVAFNKNIEQLKLLWKKKLSIYEQEETELRAQLESTVQEESSVARAELTVRAGLQHWNTQLFGEGYPQRNFHGDVEKFVQVRCEWDELVSEDGSAVPLGWVPPQTHT